MSAKHAHRTRPLWGRAPWKWLFSLRVGLVLLALLTVASIIGTLIPEVRDAAGQTLESSLERSQRLVFYSWWYKYLLLLPMALNMACATFRTIMEKVLPASRPRFQRNPQFYEATANRAAVPFAGNAEMAAAAFRARGFRVYVDGALGYAVKGMLSRWGAPISHIGIVLVLLGGFASAWCAREGGLWLVEGEQTDQMTPQGSVAGEQEPLGFTVRCEDFETGFFPRTQIPSKFVSTVTLTEPGRAPRTEAVEVNRSVSAGGWEFHQSSYRPINDWDRYILAVKPAAAGSTTATLEISPGQRRPLPGRAGVEVGVSQNYPLEWTVYERDKAVASGPLSPPVQGDWTLRAERFEPDFVMDGSSIASRSQQLNNPALKVTLQGGGKAPASQWLFGAAEMKQMMRGMHQQGGPFDVELINVEGQAPNFTCTVAVRDGSGARVGDYQLTVGQSVSLTPAAPKPQAASAASGGWTVRVQERIQAYATYLTLTRNPAIPFIYVSCAVMLLGLLVAFFVRPRQVWFRIDESGQRLCVAGIYRHQQTAGLDRTTRAVIDKLAAAHAAHAPAEAPAEVNS